MIELTLIKPDDFHNHLREGELMPHLVRETAKVFARSNVMPNLVPPVVNAAGMQKYHEELKAVGTDLEFLMTIKVMPDTTPEVVAEAKAAGASAAKLYPQGVSTHSEDGVTDLKALYPVFAALEEAELPLLIHGEMPAVEEMTAEEAFLPALKGIVANFPKLRIVLEHVSSKAGVEAVKELPETIAGTVTVHHLLLTINDVRTDHGIEPHHYCRPVCKRESDRQALLEVTLTGHHKFFLGTDSAPHLRETKEVSGEPMRGVYTTPVALPLLIELFEDHDCLPKLEAFTSKYGADFYQLPYNSQQVTFKREAWTVPGEYFGVVPLSAGEQLDWQLA